MDLPTLDISGKWQPHYGGSVTSFLNTKPDAFSQPGPYLPRVTCRAQFPASFRSPVQVSGKPSLATLFLTAPNPKTLLFSLSALLFYSAYHRTTYSTYLSLYVSPQRPCPGDLLSDFHDASPTSPVLGQGVALVNPPMHTNTRLCDLKTS